MVVVDAMADYRRLAGAKIRSDWQYRASFFTLAAASTIVQVFDFLAIYVLFTATDTLGGWTLAQVAFLYGAASICFGVGDLLIGSIEMLSARIKDGSFDVLLTRPVNTLVNLAASDFSLRRLGKVANATTVFVVALMVNDIDWTAARVLVVASMLVSGTVIALSIWVVTVSIAFWWVETREMANAVVYGGSTAIAYPVHLFDQWFRLVLLYLFPLVFVSYVPALYVLDLDSPLGIPTWWAWSGPVVAAATVVVARTVWRAGLRRYASTGS